MTLLIIGMLVWSGAHLVPSLAQPLKNNWKSGLSDKGYQLSFSLIVVLSLLMIVFGWRSITPVTFYSLPDFTRPLAILLMVVAFLLFGASHHATRIKQFIRHPQLTSFIVWSAAHLLVNGDSRSIVLFGGMSAWAVLEIIAINRREGPSVKPLIPTWSAEIKGHAISLIIFFAMVLAHPYIAGVALG